MSGKDMFERRMFLEDFVSAWNKVWNKNVSSKDLFAHRLFMRAFSTFDRYIANHPAEASMMQSMPLPDSPRLMMALTGPIFGVVSGIVLGLFAVIAARLTRARTP